MQHKIFHQKKIFTAFFLFIFSFCCAQTENKYPFQNTNLSFEQRVNDLVLRLTLEEKVAQIATRNALQARNPEKSAEMLQRLQQIALKNGNLFEELMETVKFCTLGQITHALYEVGGQYRRNM